MVYTVQVLMPLPRMHLLALSAFQCPFVHECVCVCACVRVCVCASGCTLPLQSGHTICANRPQETEKLGRPAPVRDHFYTYNQLINTTHKHAHVQHKDFCFDTCLPESFKAGMTSEWLVLIRVRLYAKKCTHMKPHATITRACCKLVHLTQIPSICLHDWEKP